MKKYLYINISAFFFALGSNVLNFSFIYRLTDDFIFSTGQIGMYIAMGLLFYFFGCNLYHRFGSALNPSKIFPVSASIVFLASIPLGYFKTLGVIYVSYWLLQLASSFFWPPVMAWITEGLNHTEINRRISNFNRSWMPALIVAPLLAGALYRWNSSVNFLVMNVCFLLSPVFLILAKRASKMIDQEASNQSAASIGSDNSASSAFQDNSPQITSQGKTRDLYRYKAWMSFFCSTMFVGFLINIIPLHIRDGLGYTESTAGMVLFSRCVTALAGFTLLARFTAWQFNHRWFIILQTGLMVCTFFFILAGSNLNLYFIIATFYGFIYSGCLSNSIFYSSATGKNHKKNLALHEMFLCAGNASGTAGGGILYQHFGFTRTCLALFAVLGIGLGVLLLAGKKKRAT